MDDERILRIVRLARMLLNDGAMEPENRREIVHVLIRRLCREVLEKNPLDFSGKPDRIDSRIPHSDGGPGSGNFGHKGVPGQVGGSAPTALARGENIPCVGFEHKKTLAWKRKKHGGMYSNMTDGEYETHAINFLKQKCGGTIDGYLDKDGAICRFDTKTGGVCKGIPWRLCKDLFQPWIQ